MRALRHKLPALAPLLLAAACALKDPPVTSDIQRDSMSNANVPAAWTADGAVAGSVQGNWVASFGDPALVALVDEALVYNANLRVAAARVEQAAAYVRVAGGELYPAATFLARPGGKLGGDGSGLKGWIVSASWEIDLWGRVRYGVRAAQDQYASALADAQYARQSIAALVVKAWFGAIEAQQQYDLATEMIRHADQLRELARQRLRIGGGTEIDVGNADVSAQTYRDAARQMKLVRDQSIRALELLVGRYPAAELAVPGKFGPLPAVLPAGVPSELLERRPDVIAAERRIAAAFDLQKQANAARLPRVNLSAGLLSVSSELFLLADRDNPTWSLGAGILLPLFQGGALQAQADLRTGEQNQALASYGQIALQAFGEVENALSAESALRERELLLSQAATENERLFALQTVRYKVGSGDLRGVAQQQLVYVSSRSTLLRVQSEQRMQLANLYLALGGGLTPAPRQSATVPASTSGPSVPAQ
ncbi:multidrug efflux system outer membrane protein [Paraburkholderia sp. GAS199]|uniref:TolC family protein n=1 Tax=Paraburkholderia sp. GAS199 TaxID=3035126 RepID=UPI003D2151BB